MNESGESRPPSKFDLAAEGMNRGLISGVIGSAVAITRSEQIASTSSTKGIDFARPRKDNGCKKFKYFILNFVGH